MHEIKQGVYTILRTQSYFRGIIVVLTRCPVVLSVNFECSLTSLP